MLLVEQNMLITNVLLHLRHSELDPFLQKLDDSHTACHSNNFRSIDVQDGARSRKTLKPCSLDNGYSINLRALFSNRCVKVHLRKRHDNMNDER